MTKDIEEIVGELKTLPIGVIMPFNQEMMWGEMIGLEADGWEKLENWLRNTLTTLTHHHEAEAEEAVKEERNRIAALCYQLPNDGEEMYHLIFNNVEVDKQNV